jgi:hypothetical protein
MKGWATHYVTPLVRKLNRLIVIRDGTLYISLGAICLAAIVEGAGLTRIELDCPIKVADGEVVLMLRIVRIATVL